MKSKLINDDRCRTRRLLAGLASMLLGVLFILQGSSGRPASASAVAAPAAHLIYADWFGNILPTPSYMAGHKAFLETQPFDGLVLYLRNDLTGEDVTRNVMSATPVSYASAISVLAPIQGQVFTNLRENFALLQGWSPPDFFDDWSVPVQNFANAARALKEAGLKGFFFDNEQYMNKWAYYPVGMRYPNRTLADYQVQARLRGKQVMEAIVAQFPDVAFLSMHGPYVSEPKVPEPLFPVWWTQNQLLGPYFSGMVEGSGSSTLNVDGGELYRLRTADEFLSSYNWRKYTISSDAINCAYIPPADRPAWPGKLSISFGVYDGSFGVTMNSAILRPTLANALRQADKYVWFYTEGPTFLLPPSQGGASSPWVDAVRQARIDAGAGLPGIGPAAPSHFTGTAASSSEVDLSWWDMSSDETGFEVERMTGTSGLWSRVLTTSANVSAINDVGLAAGTAYTYRVRAVNVSGASAYSNEVGATTTAGSLGPVAPINLSVRSVSRSGISVTWWDMSANETRFEVERKTGSAGTWVQIATEGANVSIHDDAGLFAGTTYFYRVRSANLSGASAYTNTISATTLP